MAPDGSVYLPTVEGTIHSLTSEGAFRWSYTLSHPALGAVAFDTLGRPIVAARTKKLYALETDGTLSWLYRSLVTPVVDAAVDPRGFSYLVGQEHLFAVSSRAGVLWYRELDGAPLFAPVLHEQTAFIALSNGLLRIRSFSDFKKISPLVAEAPVQANSLGPLVLAQSRLHALDFEGTERWSTSDVQAFALSKSQIAALTSSEAVWLEAEHGTVQARLPLQLDASAPPLLIDATTLAIPTTDGELAVVTKEGQVSRASVAGSALIGVVRLAGTRVVVTAGSGRVCALDAVRDLVDAADEAAQP